MFDRVVVVSLERRPDRLDAFMKRVPSDWPFCDIEVVHGVDGRLCKHPTWWRQGGGAWGCYRAHVRILEDALNSGMQSVLIFEDDATFCSNFSDAARQYLDALPEGWIQAYLGGQHLKAPKPVPGNPLVVQAQNVNRTHAFAVNGRAGITTLYRWLCATDQWVNRNHIDHHFGRLHKNATAGYYAPAQWLCGQAEGHSDISWKQTEERWWLRKNVPPEMTNFAVFEHAQAPRANHPFVAVMGVHRSGSSCIAMVLHKLGVNMGDRLVGYESQRGGGGEAKNLAAICERASRFPAAGFTHPEGQIRRNLRHWVMGRVNAAKKRRIRVGGKYPQLCAMGPMLDSICGDGLIVVDCDRPLEESIESLKKRSRKAKGWLNASDSQCESLQRWLYESKQQFLATLPAERIVRVNYTELLEDTERTVAYIVDRLGLTPTPEQLTAALSHVNPKHRTVHL